MITFNFDARGVFHFYQNRLLPFRHAGHFRYRRRFLTSLFMIQKGASSHRNVRACYSSKNYLSDFSPVGRPGCSWYAVTIGGLDPRTPWSLKYFKSDPGVKMNFLDMNSDVCNRDRLQACRKG